MEPEPRGAALTARSPQRRAVVPPRALPGRQGCLLGRSSSVIVEHEDDLRPRDRWRLRAGRLGPALVAGAAHGRARGRRSALRTPTWSPRSPTCLRVARWTPALVTAPRRCGSPGVAGGSRPSTSPRRSWSTRDRGPRTPARASPSASSGSRPISRRGARRPSATTSWSACTSTWPGRSRRWCAGWARASRAGGRCCSSAMGPSTRRPGKPTRAAGQVQVSVEGAAPPSSRIVGARRRRGAAACVWRQRGRRGGGSTTARVRGRSRLAQ